MFGRTVERCLAIAVRSIDIDAAIGECPEFRGTSVAAR